MMGFFRWVTDVGLTGPDKGKGGKYLFVPPSFSGSVPSEGYFVAKPRTNRVLIFYRAFVEGGDIAAAVSRVKAGAAIYPLSKAANPPPTNSAMALPNIGVILMSSHDAPRRQRSSRPGPSGASSWAS